MTKLIIPEGKKTGCLLRASKVGELCDRLGDRMEIIDPDDWGDWLGNGDLDMRDHVHDILDQDGVGSCATESASQGIMICRSMAGLDHVLLNPWSMYAFTSGGRDGGSNIDTNLAHCRDVGVLPMDIWPRSKGWRTRPPESLLESEASKYRIHEFFDCTSVEEVGTALIRGMPVVYGWSGHSCIMTQLSSRDEADYCNSWHESWGDKGFGKIKLRSINFGYGAFAVRTVVDS